MKNYTSIAMLRTREGNTVAIKSALSLEFAAIGEKMSDFWCDRKVHSDGNLFIATFTEFKHLPEGYELSIHLRRDDRPTINQPWSLSMGVRKGKEYLASLSLASSSLHSVFDNIADRAKQLVESIGQP